MSQHPSLRSKQKGKKHRSVLKRYERVKALKEKEKWKDGDPVFGLAKLKILKFKLKKEKTVKTEEGAASEAAPKEAQAAQPTEGAKAAAQPVKDANAKKDTAKDKGK